MKVVIAFITRGTQLLITQRAPGSHWGGYWELPGGKIEANESPQHAIIRELKEELAIEAQVLTFIGECKQKSMDFYLYHIEKFTGDLVCSAGQTDMCWLEYHEIKRYRFPDTNHFFFEIWDDYMRDKPSSTGNELNLLGFSTSIGSRK